MRLKLIQASDQGRFARSRGTAHNDFFTIIHIKIDVGQSSEIAKFFGQSSNRDCFGGYLAIKRGLTICGMAGSGRVRRFIHLVFSLFRSRTTLSFYVLTTPLVGLERASLATAEFKNR